MKHSVLMRRVFTVVILSILVTTALSAALYGAMFETRITAVRGAQLLPKARALAKIAATDESADSKDALWRLLGPKESDFCTFLGASVLIYDQNGALVKTTLSESAEDNDFIADTVSRALAGREVVRGTSLNKSRVSVVCVGVPVTRKDGAVSGCVVLIEPLADSVAAFGAYNSSWALSLMMAFPLVLLIGYVLIGRIIRPLRQMRDTANAMAAGDFSLRADDMARGEVGQLGASLNFLARELSKKIDELTLERDRLRRSVDGLAEGFLAVDADGAVSYKNPSLIQLFVSAPRYDDKRLAVIPDEKVWQAVDAVLESGSPASLDMLWADRALHVTVTPIVTESGQNAGAVALLADVTQNARLERTRRDYVANVSHELRTPLTAMRALLEPIRDGMVPSEAARARYYDIMLGEITRLSRLIDDLMELSRLQSGQTEIETRPMSIAQMLTDLADKYKPIAADHGIELSLYLPDPCPRAVSSEDRVEEVLVILIDNAIKYTPSGGSVRLGARAVGGKIEVYVRDSGVGIASSDLPYVFDRFYKADKAHSGAGSGLGLSIAREILTAMGEEIRVGSVPGSGSEFCFTLKRAPD